MRTMILILILCLASLCAMPAMVQADGPVPDPAEDVIVGFIIGSFGFDDMVVAVTPTHLEAEGIILHREINGDYHEGFSCDVKPESEFSLNGEFVGTETLRLLRGRLVFIYYTLVVVGEGVGREYHIIRLDIIPLGDN